MKNIEEIRKELALKPNNVPLLLLLAKTYLKKLQLDKSLKYFKKALHYDNNNIQALLSIAQIYDLNGKVSEAVVRVTSICQNYPYFAPAWLLLSKLHLREKEAKDSLIAYQKAINIDPKLKDNTLANRINSDLNRNKHQNKLPLAKNDENDLNDIVNEDPDEIPDEILDFEYDIEANLNDQAHKKSKLFFSDIYGYKKEKKFVKSRLLNKNKKIISPANSILICGPSGFGKSNFAQAIFGENNNGSYTVDTNYLADAYIGQNEDKLRIILNYIKKRTPAVLLFDDFDILAQNRKITENSLLISVVGQLLSEINLQSKSLKNILFVYTSNKPWNIDPAFFSMHRINKVSFVKKLSLKQRKKILINSLKKVPVDTIDYTLLAKKYKQFNYTEIIETINRVIEKTHQNNFNYKITQADIEKQIKSIYPHNKIWQNLAKSAKKKNPFHPIWNYIK